MSPVREGRTNDSGVRLGERDAAEENTQPSAHAEAVLHKHRPSVYLPPFLASDL